MNQKKLEEMGKRLVEILIATGVFKEKNCGACVGGIRTDMHSWITMDTIEKEQLVKAVNDALRMYEGECLKKAWAKHVKESGT